MLQAQLAVVSTGNTFPDPVAVNCSWMVLCAVRLLGVKQQGSRMGEEPAGKTAKTKRSHWKTGESTHWYQPGLLGAVPSLTARELRNTLVRAGVLHSRLQTF